MDDVPRLLTITETAECLACSESNVYSLIEAGRLAVVNVGPKKAYRVSLDELKRFIAAQTVTHKQPETKPAPMVPRQRLRHIRL